MIFAQMWCLKAGISFLLRLSGQHLCIPARPNDIQVPHLPVPRKITYIGFPTQEIIQPGDGLQALVYLMNKDDDILVGQKAFCIGMSDCSFLQCRIETKFMLKPVKTFSKLDCRSLMQQTRSIWGKSHHGGSEHEKPELGVQA
jgi:hypothetical protein